MRSVVALIYPGVRLLDAIGPLDVFSAANTLLAARGAGAAPYELVPVSADGRPVRCSNGIAIAADRALRATPKWIDTLLVPGTFRIEDVLPDREIVAARCTLRRASRRVSTSRSRWSRTTSAATSRWPSHGASCSS